MKKYFILSTLLISLHTFGQTISMFDTLKIDLNTKLIGRYPQFDKEKTYKEWNFLIDNPIEIKKAISELKVNEEVENTIETPSFRISLIQENKEIKTWIINPKMKSVLYNGHTYEFNIRKIKKLSKAFPFDYRFDKIPFKTKDEYINYLTKQKEDKTFLFDYSPQFKYEGSFEIQFPKNEIFSSPKAITDYLKPFIEKIMTKDYYRVTYVLTEKNINDRNQYTMTITGSKNLFDTLVVDNLQKQNWTETIEDACFFYKTK